MRTTTRVVVLTFVLLLIAKFPQNAQQTSLLLNDLEYFELPGLNVMAFQDIYPEGHQAGVSIIQNGVRVATNGDLRLDPTPGQWQPMPKQDKRTVSKERNEITTWLSYPDPSRNRTGFNPIDYPDLNLSYQVIVKGEGKNIHIVVDLDKACPRILSAGLDSIWSYIRGTCSERVGISMKSLEFFRASQTVLM